MLINERLDEILKIVSEKGSVDILYLCKKLLTSESTIRRDLSYLHEQKKLIKVRGGAKRLEGNLITKDIEIASRKNEHILEKNKIAKYCASIIEKNDYIYIDSGSSTEILAKYINVKGVCFVTNSVSVALILTRKGFDTYIIGGKVKKSTESIISTNALIELDKFNFSKGFFGANAVSIDGLTTPDNEEADVKKRAMQRCNEKYVLADSSKFDKLALVKFSEFENCKIVTEKVSNEYKDFDNIINLENFD